MSFSTVGLSDIIFGENSLSAIRDVERLPAIAVDHVRAHLRISTTSDGDAIFAIAIDLRSRNRVHTDIVRCRV